jgi:hypothetical protein
MTYRIHKEGDLQIYIFVIFCETRHYAQAHVTSGTLMHCALSLAARRTQTAAQLGWWFRWPLSVLVTRFAKHYFCDINKKDQPDASVHRHPFAATSNSTCFGRHSAHPQEFQKLYLLPLVLILNRDARNHEFKNYFCACTWSSNQSEVGAILALSNFLSHIPHEKVPDISVGYI